MLYQCPDCKGKVSSDAPACPHCGKPIAAIIAADAEKKASEAKEAEERAKSRKELNSVFHSKKWLLPVMIAAVAVIIALVLILTSSAKKEKQKPFMTAGNNVTFGSYPQTEAGNDSTPIEWLVLEYDAANNKALLISRYGLDCQPYNTEWVDVTWETCTLRGWLNGEFMNRAFSAEEQKAILTTDVDNSRSQGYSGYGTDGGKNTKDKIFLLSYAEANQYFGVQYYSVDGAMDNLRSRVAPTDHAVRQGVWTSSSYTTSEGKAAAWWWLRSPGSSASSAADVRGNGALYYDYVDGSILAVRPAFWLDLNSDIF